MEISGAFAPSRLERKRSSDPACAREVRAEIWTLGGAILLALCTLLLVAALAAVQLQTVTQLQRAILVTLTLASWIYVADSLSERLRLVDHAVEFRSLFSHRVVPLKELDSMLMVYEGFNLEKGIETIEFHRHGQKPERLSLGPCWHRHVLESFLRSVEQALQDPHLLEEVR